MNIIRGAVCVREVSCDVALGALDVRSEKRDVRATLMLMLTADDQASHASPLPSFDKVLYTKRARAVVCKQH